jgi:hypothetical protein
MRSTSGLNAPLDRSGGCDGAAADPSADPPQPRLVARGVVWLRRNHTSGVAEGDRASVRQAVIVDLFSGGAAWGIRPAPRRRSRLALRLSESEEILRGIAGTRSMRSIARLLGRAPSTVSREIKRNGGYDRYRAAAADENAWRRGRRPKGCKLANNRWLRRTVARKLESAWSVG